MSTAIVAPADELAQLRANDPHVADLVERLLIGQDEAYLRQLTPSTAERLAMWLRGHPEFRPQRRRHLPGWPELGR